MTLSSLRKTRYLASVSVIALAAIPHGAVAQDGDSSLQIEEIMVTAQKREESSQDVAMAISAFDANFMKRVNLDDVKDIVKFAPGLAGNSKDSFIDAVSIRGISTNDFGAGGDPSVGFFKNGFYQGRNGVVVSSSYDLDRAEVLRGPQGFLFGRNAIAGAVSTHTKRPILGQTSGYIDLGAGERGILEAEGAINFSTSDTSALRIAAYYNHENGYITNTLEPTGDKLIGHEKAAIRASYRYEGESMTLDLIGEYEERVQSGTVYQLVDDQLNRDLDMILTDAGLQGPIDFQRGTREISSNMGLGNSDNGKQTRLMAIAEWDLDFAMFSAHTAYTDHSYDYNEDFDGLPVSTNDYRQEQEGNYFEQELRLVGNDDGDLSWYAGVSYYREKIDVTWTQQADEEVVCQVYYYSTCKDLYENYWGYAYYGYSWEPNANGVLSEKNSLNGTYQGWAAYLDLTYKLSDTLALDVGARYTKDRKKGTMEFPLADSSIAPWINGVYTVAPVTSQKSWDEFTPRAVLRWTPNEDLMIYGSVTRGYKSGGISSFALNPDFITDGEAGADAQLDFFEPEKTWSYEVGFKTDLVDNRLRLNANLFHYTYQDLQLVLVSGGGSTVFNVGHAKSTGVEGSVQGILSKNFDIFLAGSIIASEVNSVPTAFCDGCNGNTLAYQPKYMLAGAFSYHTPIGKTGGELNASVDFRTQSRMYSDLSNQIEPSVNPWTDVSLRATYSSGMGWSVTAYLENVFDKNYYDYGVVGEGMFPTAIAGPSRPRTFGVTFSKSFGDE